jgi:hypothetical protein
MGNMKHEGDAIDVVSPGGGVTITKGELYRIDGWNGIAMSTVLPTDPELGLALEVRRRVWYVKLPAATAAARGDVLYWTAGAGFKRGDTDLSATVAGAPACKVEEAKDANNIAGIVPLNIG